MKGIVACLIVAFAVTVPSCLGSLIVGGHESTRNSRPYQVAIMNRWESQYCGGTLVHPNWVVSAAHCAGNTPYVGLGFHKLTDSANTQFIKGQWIVHPSYNSGTLDNDIALIQLQSPASTNTYVQAIDVSSSEPTQGMSLLVSGWGNTDPSTWKPPAALTEVVVKAISHIDCNYAYGGITDNMFCAGVSGGGKDSCQGDSGGPIVSNFKDDVHDPSVVLEGIVSWGYGCAEAQYPGVYTKISNYCNWIDQQTSGQARCA